MKWYSILFFFFSVGTVFAQSESWENIDRKTEIKWIVLNEIREQPRLGDYITVYLDYLTDTDSLLYSTSTTEKGFLRLEVREPEFNGDLMAAMLEMHLLDSAHMRIPANTFFPKILKMNRPTEVSGRSDVLVHTRLVKIQTAQELAIEMNNQRKKAMDSEPERIQQYLDKIDFDGQQLPCGAYIKWTNRGRGVQPVATDQVQVRYIGELFSGKEFDRSEAPFKFPVGKDAVIQAWDEALVRMKEGDVVTLVTPSKAAYGARGVPGTIIGPFEPLVFEIELLHVIR